MLIYVKHYGQMCNRLWAIMPVIAYALQKKKKLYVIFAKKSYLGYFPHLKKCKWVRFMFSHNCNHPKSLEWRLSLLSEKYNLELKEDLKTINHVGLFSFVDGWQHSSDVSYIIEQKLEIVKIFEPEEKVIRKVNYYFDKYKGITIGVHVRRGDYKDYLDGKYFFSDEVYLDAITQVRKLFSYGNGNVRFLICSNEPFNVPQNYGDIFSIDNTDGMIDLYALSCCDYIVGPPSSYSQWASFYGNVPLCMLLDENIDINKESFSRIVSFNTFENGKCIKLNSHKNEYYLE